MTRLRPVVIWILSLQLAVLGPLLSYGQAPTSANPVLPDQQKVIRDIQKVSIQAIGRIRYLILNEPDLTNATADIRSVRNRSIALITNTVNSYKAATDPYLTRGNAREADVASKAQLQIQIAEVEWQAQQAVDEIELAIRQPLEQSVTPSARANQGYIRSGLPERQFNSVIGRGNQAPPGLTSAYVRTGGQPFLPVSPNIQNVIYRLNQPPEAPRPNTFQTIGLAIGGFLGLRQFYNQKATIQISRFAPVDQSEYRVSFNGLRSTINSLKVPAFGQPLRQEIEPGNYTVFYHADSISGATATSTATTITTGQFAAYPIVIRPGETWCFQVPRAPSRCY